MHDVSPGRPSRQRPGPVPPRRRARLLEVAGSADRAARPAGNGRRRRSRDRRRRRTGRTGDGGGGRVRDRESQSVGRGVPRRGRRGLAAAATHGAGGAPLAANREGIMAKLKYREALRAALQQEMERDESVFILGEGIGERGGSYKVTEGLMAQFGAGRVIDTPLSEAGFVGLGVGAAIAGQRPVVEMLFIDFLLLAMDQVINQAAQFRFMSGGEGRVPLVIRTQGGTGNSLAGQHYQSLEALYYHIPGLKVVMPSTPRDAKGLLIAAIRDDDPVIFIEHKLLYMTDGEVPDEPYEIPLGEAEIKRPGTDVTLVTWSHMVLKSLQAAEDLAAD